MMLFNETFLKYKYRFMTQCLLIIVFIACILIALGSFTQNILTAVGATTLASSIFALFAVPKSPIAAAYRVFGGYIIGILVGLAFHAVQTSLIQYYPNLADPTLIIDLSAAVAVGIAMIFMAFTSLIHPPCAGLALALVIGPWDAWIIGVIIISVLILCAFKYVLRDWFINLL